MSLASAVTYCCVLPKVTRSGIGSPEAKSANVRPSSSFEFLGREDEASGGVATVVARDRASSIVCRMDEEERGMRRVIMMGDAERLMKRDQ